MEKLGKNIAERIRALCEPAVNGLGCVVWDAEYVKEGAEMVLRLTIDKEGGVGIDDCEAVHRAIDPLLDEADLIEDAYRLEVSSPGIERTLSRPEHFASCLGETVEVRLFAPMDGRRVLKGTLADAGERSFVLEENGKAEEIAYKAASKVSTVFDWSGAGA